MGPRHTTHSPQARHGCRRTLSAPAVRGANRRARPQLLRAPACTVAGAPRQWRSSPGMDEVGRSRRPEPSIGWFRPTLRLGSASAVPANPSRGTSNRTFAVTSIVGSRREVSRAHFVHRVDTISCWRSHAKAAGSAGHVMRVAWPTTAGMQELEQCRSNCRDRSPSGRARLPPGAGGRSCASCARGINASMHVTPVGDLFSQAPAILSASRHGVDRARAASVATRRRGEAARVFTGRTR